MKVKALVKAAVKSKKNEIAEKYSDKDRYLNCKDGEILFVYIDGCFTPYSKAREDKRKVDNYYFSIDHINNTLESRCYDQCKLCINTVYVKESAAHAINDEKFKKDKKKDKEKKNKKEKKG